MKKIFIILSLIIVVILSIIIYFIHENNLFENNYNEIVKTTKKINLYDENNNIIGKIEPDTYLYLENKSNKKYKIKNENYYIDFHNVKKDNVDNSITLNYFNEVIITNESFNLYKENVNQIHINKTLKFNIYKKLDDGYLIYYLNQYFIIKKQ